MSNKLDLTSYRKGFQSFLNCGIALRLWADYSLTALASLISSAVDFCDLTGDSDPFLTFALTCFFGVFSRNVKTS